ncbi:hypothetical protein GLW05_04555 [Pontibacillus yanchengensis]|uniref:Uncharacterized protein n=1 Tax=Pontibacillus yanchengensis TaxID=462910 RepID=A0A6I4ZUL6_9BACI|nr:hypothetical protein [Pontibacillus yanchengensis]MYL32864.1 hypothetical protein [Pontibacillus yanchengensis]
MNLNIDFENSKLVVHYKYDNESIKHVKKIVRKQLPSKIKFNKVDFTPEDLNNYVNEMVNILENKGELKRIAVLDPDAHKESIHVAYNEELSTLPKKN